MEDIEEILIKIASEDICEKNIPVHKGCTCSTGSDGEWVLGGDEHCPLCLAYKKFIDGLKE